MTTFTLPEIAERIAPGDERTYNKLKGLRTAGVIPSHDERVGRGAGVPYSEPEMLAMATALAMLDFGIENRKFLKQVWAWLLEKNEAGDTWISHVMACLAVKANYPAGGGYPALVIRTLYNPSTHEVGKTFNVLDGVQPEPPPPRKGYQVAMTLRLDLSVILQRFV